MLSQYFNNLVAVVVRLISRTMPVLVPSNLREREVAAAVKHLAAANLRGSTGVDVGDCMAVIEDNLHTPSKTIISIMDQSERKMHTFTT